MKKVFILYQWKVAVQGSFLQLWPVCEDLHSFLFLMFCWLSYQLQPAATHPSSHQFATHSLLTHRLSATITQDILRTQFDYFLRICDKSFY